LTKSIKDLWILSENGIVVFQHIESEEISSDLFGAMISALNTYAEILSEGGISSFNLKEYQFIVKKKGSLFFIAKTSKKLDAKKIRKELKILAEKFFEMFPEQTFNHWNGGVTSMFSKFKQEFED